jgi:hypothetical protein
MDPVSRRNTVHFALAVLSQITNDEIEEHRAQLALIVTRISSTATKISSRTETAVSVLNIAVAKLSETVRFLKENSDPTNPILETVVKANDPRTAFLSGSTDLPSSLLRALSTRYLVGKFEERYGEKPHRKIKKIDLYIVPTVALIYLFCFIDRANIGMVLRKPCGQG